jgi:hypothetical protein
MERPPSPVPLVRLAWGARGPLSCRCKRHRTWRAITACESSVPYEPLFSNLCAPWPALAARIVMVGGITVAYSEALRAVEILAGSRTSAIAPVLRAAGNGLAGCDYFGAAAPYLEAARALPKTGRAGAAGRHVTKVAFTEAVTRQLARAREAELRGAMAAFRSDERYAVAIASEAVSLREHAYASGVRSSVRASVARAVAACGALEGQFTCNARTACGTGGCRFASPEAQPVTAAAGPGRFTRPPNHVHAGQGFGEAAATAELQSAGSYRAGVHVWDAEARAA